MATAPKKKTVWKLTVNLMSGHEIIHTLDSKADALAFVGRIISAGYEVEDRSSDPSVYDCQIHPVHQIKAFHVVEKEI